MVLIAMLIREGKRKRRPPELRMRAIEAALQALCWYYSPLANRVNASLTTMSICCGLATEKKRLSIKRFTGPAVPGAAGANHLQHGIRSGNWL